MRPVAWARRVLEDMTSATNRVARELPGPPVRPVLTLLEGRVQDFVLIGRALAGGARSKAAEEELYRRYRPAVSRLAASFSELDPDEAEDVVQEAFVRAFRALASLKDRERFAAWLFTIARNRARSYLTSRATHNKAAEDATREANLLVDHVPAASHAMEKEAELRAVREVIDGLREGPGEGDRPPLLPGGDALGPRDRLADGSREERRHHAPRAVPGQDRAQLSERLAG